MTDETKRIGDYQILDELGSGGMGRVWRARNVITDRIEAIKVLLPDLAGRQELAARFQREIKLMASLNHPNIAALRTAFTADNQLYMVMEYVEGTTVAQKLERGAIPVPDALNYIRQVLDAVSYAHKQNVIHRDIKPANMMLTPLGTIKLMDFGIARGGEDRSLTMTGTTMGSLSYMSPEQVKGEATDARSDLYSVGVSLYEMVTGQRPFLATSDYSIMAAHVRETPKPPVDLHPGLPAELNEIILMAIAKDPAGRFQTADAFRNALSSVPVSAAAPAPAIISGVLGAPTVDAVLPPAASLQTGPITNASGNISAPAQAPQEPKMAPYTSPVPVPPLAQSSGHRGLYMTLGALIVLAVLVAAGLYMPRSFKTHASRRTQYRFREFDGGKHGEPESCALILLPAKTLRWLRKLQFNRSSQRRVVPRRPPLRGQLECHATTRDAACRRCDEGEPGDRGCVSREIESRSRKEAQWTDRWHAGGGTRVQSKSRRGPRFRWRRGFRPTRRTGENRGSDLQPRCGSQQQPGALATAAGCKWLRPARRHGGEAG